MISGSETGAHAGAYEVWGLTGGIAAGKSAAARIFEEQGFPVLDADALSRELSAPGGAAHAAIVRRFGTADRAQLRQIVFADPAARKDLEAILHPMIVAESQARLARLAQAYSGPGKARIIYEAALLVETGRYRQLDGLIVIDAPVALRRTRLISRDGTSPELADKILSAQASDAERQAAATVLIANTGSIEELRSHIIQWIGTLG